MKNLFLFLILTSTFFIGFYGCRGNHGPVSPSSTATATVTQTPTANMTPVCGMTPVNLSFSDIALSEAGVTVIHDQAQWSAFAAGGPLILSLTPVPTATPVPAPVDFNSQMLVVASVPEPCGMTNLDITSVCEGPNQVVITVNQTSPSEQCFVASAWAQIDSAVAVPQSNLPVTVIYTNIPFNGVHLSVLTPTPTP